MSDDPSMFKKVRDKITDEVSSATNKLQNMQIIDQLATTIGQPSPLRNEAIPQQTLPRLPEQIGGQSSLGHFNLAYDNSNSQEEEELNSESSPQHQLFNEQIIRRLKPAGGHSSTKDKQTSDNGRAHIIAHPVIDIENLSSDIDDDVEVDLLHEKEIPSTSLNEVGLHSHNHLDTYKTRYRELVHAARKLNIDYQADKSELQSQLSELRDHIIALDRELNVLKQQRQSSNESDRKDNSSSPHQSGNGKQNSKIRDLEKLMAKCKESLKAKNTQLKILKDSLSEVDKFQSYINDIKNELRELRNAHETWTLSIAENKRVMHQEIEDKNSEINDLQMQLRDSNNKVNQLKTTQQNLESRLVSTSAAHQRERVSLTKELTAQKNTIVKQLQRDHELHTERIRLDLEKSIEALKTEILTKDEVIIRSAEKQNELQRQNCSLTTDLESAKKLCTDRERDLTHLKTKEESQTKEIEALKAQLEATKDQSIAFEELTRKNECLEREKRDLSDEVSKLTEKVNALEISNEEQKQKLELAEAEALKSIATQPCGQCRDYQDQTRKDAEQYEQSLFELNAKLDLLTTANGDQEQALRNLNDERNSSLETIKSLRLECEDLVKKNTSLLQVMQDNESEMQAQQDQLDQLKAARQQLDDLKKENASFVSSLDQIKSELKERNNDLRQSNDLVASLKSRLAELEQAHRDSCTELDSVKSQKLSLVADLQSEQKKRKDADQQLVVNILAALKNLETPDTSPGSDKTYSSEKHESGDPYPTHHGEPNLPDPLKLAENLSSLALDRSTAYMTSNQRLQAVLLDNTMISEEVSRLKEELNALSQEKTKEVMSSIEEVERLRTENQALIHDQKAYDDHITHLEAEIESLKQKLAELTATSRVQPDVIETSTTTSDLEQAPEQSVALVDVKNQEIEQLNAMLADKEEELRERRQQMVEPEDVPSSTEFEYLKNIVYQFLMGREPITLARVISAIFKFDQEQIDQICKVQEVIHQVSG